ncbi:MAG: cell division protein FtsZ [Bacteroidales bacterium]|nr:cell division protein FtsZ [Bacteroidales bacterium]
MEDNANTNYFTFDAPKNQSSIIKVIGVGGGGGNAVNHMFRQGINGVDFVVCNTDMKALNSSPIPNKISIGELGAGNDPAVAKQAALDHADTIREALSHNTKMLFITAGMGGGTGTGAAPIIAEIAKSIDTQDKNISKILTVAIVTLPFSFEGKRRLAQAEDGIKELSQHVDSIIVINNDKLRTFGNLGISKAFAMADDVLLTAVKGIAEIITNNAYINIDLKDVNTVMQGSGTALMGSGSGSGENRAHDAIEAATTSVLLDDNDINGAKNVLLYFSYSTDHELTMDEQAEITDYLLEKTNGTADFIWGAGTDDSLGETLKVILIATGFDKKEVQVIDLNETDNKAKTTASDKSTISVLDEDGMVVDTKLRTADPAPVATETPVSFIQPAPSTPSHDIEEEPILIVSEKTTPAPADTTPAPAPEEKGNVFTLDDFDDAPTVSTPRHIRAGSQEFLTEIDATVGDEITLIHHDEHSAAAPSHSQAPSLSSSPVDLAPETIAPAAPTFSPAPEFAAAPHPVAPATPKPENHGFSEALAQDRAERIRFIHNQLRNNPNGGVIVQNIPAFQLDGDEPMADVHSSEREASSTIVRSDGSVADNLFLWGNHPD